MHDHGDDDDPDQLGRAGARPSARSGRGVAKWNCERAIGMAMRNRAPLTIQLAVEMRTPELTARVAS